jgi:hypothetical protein
MITGRLPALRRTVRKYDVTPRQLEEIKYVREMQSILILQGAVIHGTR